MTAPLLTGVYAGDPYRVECQYPKDSAWGRFTDAEGWVAIASGSQHYCRGYIDARTANNMRVAHRIRHVKSDRIIDQIAPLAEAPIGMVAGFPTQDQHIEAAKNVLRRAASPWQDGDDDLTRRAAEALAALERP